MGYYLDEKFDIMSRVGLHCSPSAHKTIGTFPDGTVRLSLGTFTTEDDIDMAINSVNVIANKREFTL